MKVAQNTVLRLEMKLRKSEPYRKVMLTRFEEIFEEYKIKFYPTDPSIS
ncbi:Uncharacterised protein [Streptococcus pneumoniae]|nr:Uncharacterised protein [Streptococcus pneumoniae]